MCNKLFPNCAKYGSYTKKIACGFRRFSCDKQHGFFVVKGIRILSQWLQCISNTFGIWNLGVATLCMWHT